jgi:hypothetical protein
MLILTHIGNNIPNYIENSILQIKKINPNYKVIFLVNQSNCDHIFFKRNNIETFPIESLVSDRVTMFLKNFCGRHFSFWNEDIIYGEDEFWCVSAVRLFLIYEYCNKNNVKSFFHFENDVLIYEKFEAVESVIKKNLLLENKILITRGDEYHIMTGFMYVADLSVYEHMLDELNKFVCDKSIFQSFNGNFNSEMGLLHLYQKLNSDKILNLPIFIDDNLCLGENGFNSVFDPATYGQFLDGIPSEPGRSILPESHFISEKSKTCQNFKVNFKYVDGLKIPFISCNNVEVKINSLHIHSKRLELFLS